MMSFVNFLKALAKLLQRLQAFQLQGDAILDLLTDAPDAARLIELPKGVQAQNVRVASATSADAARCAL